MDANRLLYLFFMLKAINCKPKVNENIIITLCFQFILDIYLALSVCAIG